MPFQIARNDLTKMLADVKAFVDSNYVQEKSSQEYLYGGEAQRLEQPSEPSAARAAKPRLPTFQRGGARPLSAPRQRSLAQVMEDVGENFQERLLRLIKERGMTNAEVYKKANLDRKLFSKILCSKDYHPRKQTVLAFAIALELNLDETKDLLARAEYALSPGSKSDLVVEYFIVHEIYDVFTINAALFEYGQPLLGGS